MLAHELNLESRQTRMTTNEFAKREVARVRAEGDAYVRRIEVEKRKIAELETGVAAIQAKIFEQRHRTGGLNATRDNSKVSCLANLPMSQPWRGLHRAQPGR